jgi:hypothetical protein
VCGGHDPQDFAHLRCGEHNEYYLNDCLALAEWARQHGYALVRVPAVRGSRQSFNVKLPTTILNNVSACL